MIVRRKMGKRFALINLLAVVFAQSVVDSAELEQIRTVGIGSNRAIVVNEKPFFPIMLWLRLTFLVRKRTKMTRNWGRPWWR